MSRADETSRKIPLGRITALLGIWIVLTDASLKDLPVGILAIAMATWVSVTIRPPTDASLHLRPALIYVATFLRQSVAAGLDVARRAFDPALPLKPGFILFSPTLSDPRDRTLFADLASMAPGTLPVEETANGKLLVHCLDVDMDIPAQMEADEARLAAALGRELSHA
jgi:multicomponent Na+:H+ antiporter subunit E